MTPQTAIAKCRKRYRLEPRVHSDGQTYWMVLDEANSGSGRPGTEAEGNAEYEKVIMFRALELIDPDHEWHDYDWHTLEGPAEDRVAQMMTWRADCDKASSTRDGIVALASLMCRQPHSTR